MTKKSTSKKVKNPTKKASNAQSPRVEGNPFRDGSSYGAAYDILAKHQEGLPRQKLVELLAKATGKSVKRAGFDVAVIMSAKNSVNSPRHLSCRNGFFIEKTNGACILRTK